MAQKKSSTTNEKESLEPGQRTALDSAGQLGSIYDGFRDLMCKEESVRRELLVPDQHKIFTSSKVIHCQIKKGNNNKNANLLQVINMVDELRLSVLLGLTSRDGMASIIDYPHQINECTRFLYYSYVGQKEQISDKIEKIRKMHKSSALLTTTTTHIITGVTYGIDILVILQLPSENSVSKQIDDLLTEICACLKNNKNASTLTSDNKNLLRKITDITVHSNISSLMEVLTLHDVCLYIEKNKNEATIYPIMYTLRPIKWMFPECTEHGINFTSTPKTFREEVERYVIDFSNTVKYLKDSLDGYVTQLLHGNLDQQLRDVQRQLLRLTKTYETIVERLGNIIFEIRKNRTKSQSNEQTLKNMKEKTLKDIDAFKKSLAELEEKGKLIGALEKQKFRYCDASERHVTKKDNDQTLIQKLKTKNKPSRVLCTNDQLNKKDPAKVSHGRDQLADERKANPDIDIIYADFSYSGVELNEIKIPTEKSTHRKTTKKKTRKKSSSETETHEAEPFDTEDINILLLGESGVGKSTFINAFVNYLTSETFEKAQSNDPVVLIPVSFVLTVGHDFEERLIKFGDFVSSHNEDFDHPGESVTQHCKSYEFHLNHDNGRKLCIIDTPGFGDTRGLDQDDINIQDILEYVNNLSHLNAVCFLLKPNATRLHIFFRNCLTQLFDLLGPNIRQNLIFCFTNARSTFYTPGDTAPVLNSLLKSLSMTDIPFNKENTFCFDNESFRYLVALQNEITFDDQEEHDYKTSWSKSVVESDRLIKYIQERLKPCCLDGEWKSIKHAQIEIMLIIRPMLETMRHFLRNSILSKMDSSNKSLKLTCKPIHRPSAICYECPLYPIKISNFWIIREITHEFRKKCIDCECSIHDHTLINYVLDFEESNIPSDYPLKKMIDIVYDLCSIGAKFDYFLTHVAHSSKHKLFWKGLTRMITEENHLCQNQKSNRLNKQLFKDLNELKCQYEEQIESLNKNSNQTTLSNIYQSIIEIHNYPIIQYQITASKESQKTMAEPYELSQD